MVDKRKPQANEEVESTRVAVMKLEHNRRRRFIGLGALGVVLAVLLGTWMAFSARSCMSQRAAQQARFDAAFGDGAVPTTPEPSTGLAKVYVFMSQPGTLRVDDDELGKVQSKKLELRAGDHVITATVGGVTARQGLRVKPGEEFLVEFDDKGNEPRLRRLFAIPR
jgi:hypothetical protein